MICIIWSKTTFYLGHSFRI